MRLDWLPACLRAAGLTVIEHDDWKGRGRDMQAIHGIVWHDTVTGTNWSDVRVANLLRDGRDDLPGPLAQLGLDRQGRFWMIADGLSNHNGKGIWGNQSIGIEAFNDGVGEPFPDAQYRAWVTGSRAICKRLGLTASKVMGHKETDPSRKIDPPNIDMNQARRDIAHPQREDDLMVKIWNVNGTLYGALYVNGGKTAVQAWHLTTQERADYLVNAQTPVEPQHPSIFKKVTLVEAKAA